MVEMTQPVNSTQSSVKREAFFFRTSPISTSYNGFVWKKNADYVDYGGWVISIIAGRVEVTADIYFSAYSIRTAAFIHEL
jgi:hypothetical protein